LATSICIDIVYKLEPTINVSFIMSNVSLSSLKNNLASALYVFLQFLPQNPFLMVSAILTMAEWTQ
jgi:hypothetical protein